MPQSNGRPAWEEDKERNRWDKSDNPTKFAWGAFWRSAIGITLIVLFVLGLGAGIWWLKVATSGVRGKGDVTIQNNSGTNQINSQAYFQALYNDIQGYQVKIAQAKADVKTHPGDDFYTTNLDGAYNTCVDAVTSYNAATQQTLFKDWKDAGLPDHIDIIAACGQPGASP